jgi:hypothetical protein
MIGVVPTQFELAANDSQAHQVGTHDSLIATFRMQPTLL